MGLKKQNFLSWTLMYMSKSLCFACISFSLVEKICTQRVLVYVLEVMLDRCMYLINIVSSQLVVGSTCHLCLIHWKFTLGNLYFCHCYIFYT